MRHATLNDYNTEKIEFINKHSDDGSYKERGEVEGETIRKIIICKDGAVWTEVSIPVYETLTDTRYGLNLKATVKLLETEWWNDDDSRSRVMYDIYR